MTQYIDKAALVVEIDKRLDELWDLLPNASDVIKDNYTKEEANITGKYTEFTMWVVCNSIDATLDVVPNQYRVKSIDIIAYELDDKNGLPIGKLIVL